MFGFHETHHEAFRRAAEESIDDVFNVFADDLLATDSGFVEISAICQKALNRNVSSSWLLSFIGFVLLHLFDQLLESRELFGCEVLGFHETHHEAFRRARFSLAFSVMLRFNIFVSPFYWIV